MMRVAVGLGIVAALTAFAASPVQAAPVPSSLKALESSAEDLVDFALSGSRRETAATAAKLTALASGPAAATLGRSGVASARIVELELTANRVARLVPHGPFVRVALAANAVSGLMPGLYAHFQDRVPPSVLELDYLDREAQLRSLARERKQVGVAVKRLASTWMRLRPKVVAAGGAASAAAYDKHVAAMKRVVHGALKNMREEAVHGLALVDELEQVFMR
jgi:hypothetical protein